MKGEHQTTPRDPVALLREIARTASRKNACLSLYKKRGAMPHVAFLAILGTLVALRVYSILTMVVAYMGGGDDPSTWATGEAMVTALHTPFHGSPNPFGQVFQIFVALHNLTGIALFVLCVVPLAAKKGSRMHVLFGRAFVVVWLLHLIDGLANSGQILIARGFDATRYPDAQGEGFSLYLYIQFAFISAMVIDFLAHGLAAIRYKTNSPSRSMRAVMLSLPITSLLFGVGIGIWGIARLVQGGAPETPNTYPFAVVFIVQVPPYIYLIARNIQYWLRPTPQVWLHGWLMEHQRNMTFCVQVTLYTGLANLATRFAPIAAPFLFIAIDAGFLLWIFAKERALRRMVVGSRLGLALTSALRTRRRSTQPAPSPADTRLLLNSFGADESGQVTEDDLRGVLAQEGVQVTPEELAVLALEIDRDGDGKMTEDEIERFLARWFLAKPTWEDELAHSFRLLDLEGDGGLSRQDLLEGTSRGGLDVTADELDEIMQAVDREGTGRIEWADFAGALRDRVTRF